MLWGVTCFGRCVMFVALCRDASEGTGVPVPGWMGSRGYI